MDYQSAKCPSCGARLEINERMENCVCDYCSSIVRTDDILKEDNTKILRKVRVEEVSPAQNEITYGRLCLTAFDWDNAYRAFCEAIDEEPDNFEAWHGCLASLTYNFTDINRGLANMHGVTGFASTLKNSLLMGNRKQKRAIIAKIAPIAIDMRKNEISVYEARHAKYKEAVRKRQTKKWVHISLLIIFIFMAIFARRIFGGGIVLFIFFTLYPIIVLSKMKNKPTVTPKDKPYLNQKLLQNLEYIERVINEFA